MENRYEKESRIVIPPLREPCKTGKCNECGKEIYTRIDLVPICDDCFDKRNKPKDFDIVEDYLDDSCK